MTDSPREREPEICGWCKTPITRDFLDGNAKIGDVWYHHRGDTTGPTCYMQASSKSATPSPREPSQCPNCDQTLYWDGLVKKWLHNTSCPSPERDDLISRKEAMERVNRLEVVRRGLEGEEFIDCADVLDLLLNMPNSDGKWRGDERCRHNRVEFLARIDESTVGAVGTDLPLSWSPICRDCGGDVPASGASLKGTE